MPTQREAKDYVNRITTIWRRRVDLLSQYLVEYGGHLPDCTHRRHPGECSCGWRAILQRAQRGYWGDV